MKIIEQLLCFVRSFFQEKAKPEEGNVIPLDRQLLEEIKGHMAIEEAKKIYLKRREKRLLYVQTHRTDGKRNVIPHRTNSKKVLVLGPTGQYRVWKADNCRDGVSFGEDLVLTLRRPHRKIGGRIKIPGQLFMMALAERRHKQPLAA